MRVVQKEDISLPSISLKEHVEADQMGINTLNDDCLIHIIQYLPIADRVRIERVCKRWLAISLDSWRSFKNINFDSDYWGFSKPETLGRLVNRRIFKKVLNRCGKFLISIDFSDSNGRLGPNILNSVAGLCPNVQDLDASDIEVSPWSLRVLSEKCSKLVSFSVGNSTDDCDYELSLLFENNRELKRLGVYSNFEITGECLKKLNGRTIESIIFENCPSIALDNFQVVSGFRKLKQLVLEHFHDSSIDTMKGIGSCFKSLKYLTLALCPFPNSLQHISKLRNLKILDLSANASVDDELLASVGANCKLLKQVDISYCSAVTNTGLASIISLPDLESLYVEDLNNIDDQVFRAMPTLRTMDCSHCANMRDAGLVKLIEASENMEHLFLSSCKNISNELLEAAIRATKKRTNQVVLKLHLSNTDVQLSNASGTSPFLRVVPMIVVTNVGKLTRTNLI